MENAKLFLVKHHAQDLLADLEQINPDQLDTKSIVTRSVVDINESLEAEQAYDRFSAYVEKVVPESRYLFDTINNHAANLAEEEEKLLAKVSAYDFNRKMVLPTGLGSLTPEAENELKELKARLAEQTLKPPNQDGSSEPDNTDLMQPQAEGMPSLVFDLEDSEKDDDIGVLQKYSERVIIGNISTDIFIEHERSIEDESKKLQQHEERIILEQVGFDEAAISRSNFVYLFGLPFDLEAIGYPVICSQISLCLQPLVEVKSIRLFGYRNFLNDQEYHRTTLIPKSLGQYFDVNNRPNSHLLDPFIAYGTNLSEFQSLDSSDVRQTVTVDADLETQENILSEAIMKKGHRGLVPKPG